MKSKVADLVEFALKDGEDIVVYPDLRDALIGYMRVDRRDTGKLTTVAVYSMHKAVQAIIDQSGPVTDMNEAYTDAEEFIAFNYVNAYLGPTTPVFLAYEQLLDPYADDKKDEED